MDFLVLGPLRVTHGDASVSPGPAKDRVFLGEMLAHAGTRVSVAHLTSALWPERPPANPANAVQVRVSRLRAMLRSVGGPEEVREILRTDSGGYLLARGPGDLERLRETVRSAGESPEARRALGEALALWRDEPFADVPDTPCVVAERERVRGLRLTALELYTDLCLREGDPGATLALDLVEQAALHPLRESLHERLIRLLHATGRSAEALEAYEGLRRTLAEELGCDPGSRLQELHQRILREQYAAAPEGSAAPARGTGAGEAPSPPQHASPPPRAPEPARSRTGRSGSLGGAVVGAFLSLAVLAQADGPVEQGPTAAEGSVRPVPGDNSRFDGDITFPDGSLVEPGLEFVKVWQISNTGSVPWHERYLTAQEERRVGSCNTPERVPVPPAAPGESVLVSVTVTAASEPGQCKVVWKMTDADGRFYFPQLKGIFFDVTVTGEDGL
ncbi:MULTISPECIES: BTAD domain-containing putative transcriptional regulator [unclassified Nocardiopsis]|uniref:BTAD domain-containing putative transcriptional regulator n=1 Tax=unclassified Nocardiopsis TaxID=2649073 RepID=UPI00135A5852|nr:MULTISPECIES: BTAD domain-containing putative transcriptional regulator [unclassified Nocardiopsis]